jgi:hypothetical protein
MAAFVDELPALKTISFALRCECWWLNGVGPLIQPRFWTRTGMDFAAGTWLPSAWCHSGSRELHSG